MDGMCITQGEMRNDYKILVGKPQEKRHCLGDIGVDGKIILKWV
jgi:hypothetical protein